MGTRKSKAAGAGGASVAAVPPGSKSPPIVDGDMAVVVSHDGTICSVVQAPPSVADNPAALNGMSLADLWPAAQVARIRENVRGCIRSRQFHCEEIADGELQQEFTYVGQGQDRALVLVRDTSARKHALDEIRELAYVDERTRLPNLQYLRKELDTIIENLRLTEGRAAVVTFDIEQVLSHGMSYNPRREDRVLRELAARFTQELRGANTERRADYERYSAAARIDFRQFAVVLPCIESGADAEAVAARLIESLEQPIRLENHSICVSARAGIALFPQDGNDGDTLIENATLAMEDARSSNTEPYKFHSGTASLPALQRKDLELEMRTALEREEFRINYLPIVDAATGCVHSVEALLRWPQELFANRPIAKVVALAEHTGLILPIGEWVLRTACRQLRTWQRAGYATLRLAVNLSVQELARQDLAATVGGILDECGVEASMLDFEITEYMLFRDAMKDYQICRSLQKLGANVTVDDYGIGACSLAHLARSSVNALKIDNSFVERSTASARERAAIAAAVAMARQLGIRVIAEGVETDAQANLMRTLGCEWLQGFLFSKPGDADTIGAFLDKARKP